MNHESPARLILMAVTIFLLSMREGGAAPEDYFAIQVVDEQTGRGVPMMELKATSGAVYQTDSNGLVAFHEPGLMNRAVWFHVSGHGYEFPKDGLGFGGMALEVRPGGAAKLEVKRTNIAQRLYRVTGQGIYRDTVLLGRKPPLQEPLLNAEVVGQDGILTTVYRDRVYWFWGDTLRLRHPLGNFKVTGATSAAPGQLDAARGIDLQYFKGPDGFARSMAAVEGEGVVWVYAVVTLPDARGRERMAAYFIRLLKMDEPLETGVVVYDDAKEMFVPHRSFPKPPLLTPTHYPFPVTVGGVRYIYFPAPYPCIRVRADLDSFANPEAYKAYTCLSSGARYEGANTRLERDATGSPAWSWKKDTASLTPDQVRELTTVGLLKPAEVPFRLEDAAGAPVKLQNASCFWNAYRRSYVMIGSEAGGATPLGEVWFAESAQPEGPWHRASKIITHANKKDDAHSFYNPTHHPFLDQDGGRLIYLEGSYTNAFSGNSHDTPYYEYNQIMYQLDLSDPRLGPRRE